MDKKFRGRVSSARLDRSSGNMSAGRDENEPKWPSVSGPKVPENDPKLWKTPGLDMASSLAFLRRELAVMQLQDRGIHKQLLALNDAIRDLKTSLNESWDSETDSLSLNQTLDDNVDGEVLSPTNSLSTQVSHTKQDSGILTDEDSDEQCDVFESPQHPVRPPRRSYSVSCLTSGSKPELDINQNVKTPIKGYSHSRSRTHTVGETQFYRVTSMPVINENPSNAPTNLSVSGKAFAISGYKPRNVHKARSRDSNGDFQPLSRHESMPVLYNIGRTSVRHVRSETAPAYTGIHNSYPSTNHVTNVKTKTKKRPLYRIWRSSSQISLV